jgi:cell division protein FtsZ
LINVDFADVKTVMSEMGQAMMGSASATGPTRAAEAARNALSSPLLEDTNIRGAKGILVNVTAGPGLTIGEFGEVGNMIREMASEDATVVIGTSIDPEMKDELRVTMVATGIMDGSEQAAKQPRMEVVQQVGKAVGSDYSPSGRSYGRDGGTEGGYSNGHYDSLNDIEASESMLVSGTRGRDSSELPLFDTEGQKGLDVPTFLRRQAD